MITHEQTLTQLDMEESKHLKEKTIALKADSSNDSEDESISRNDIITEYKCMINRTEAFELADHEEFQDIYIKALNF